MKKRVRERESRKKKKKGRAINDILGGIIRRASLRHYNDKRVRGAALFQGPFVAAARANARAKE